MSGGREDELMENMNRLLTRATEREKEALLAKDKAIDLLTEAWDNYESAKTAAFEASNNLTYARQALNDLRKEEL